MFPWTDTKQTIHTPISGSAFGEMQSRMVILPGTLTFSPSAPSHTGLTPQWLHHGSHSVEAAGSLTLEGSNITWPNPLPTGLSPPPKDWASHHCYWEQGYRQHGWALHPSGWWYCLIQKSNSPGRDFKGGYGPMEVILRVWEASWNASSHSGSRTLIKSNLAECVGFGRDVCIAFVCLLFVVAVPSLSVWF